MIRGPKRIKKYRVEEEALKQLVEDPQGKKKVQEDELWLEFKDDMTSWDPAK